MESVENILKTVREQEHSNPIDWSNGTGYGNGSGEGSACGTAQNGYGIAFKETVTEDLEGIREFNGRAVYHIEEHPIIINKVIDEGIVQGYEICADMSLNERYVFACNNTLQVANTLEEAKNNRSNSNYMD